jgi:glycyl-tRNA synthetase beta chain
MDFLFEIGLEEVPARMIAAAQAELLKRVTVLLTRERLITTTAAKSLSTPRRLAVLISNVAARQNDEAEEVQGPATKIAFKDGVPGPAAIAFAKKNGVEVTALRVTQTPKGEYIVADVLRPGKSAAEVLTAELPKEIAAIYWPKNMYWRAGKPEKFVRPVRWLLALLGNEVVPVEFGGYTAGRVTYGHRVLHGAEPIEILEPTAYAAALEAAYVMADVDVRRHTIRKALDRVCRTIPNTRWREDHALVDKMTHMTEWPSVIAGDFDPDYLSLPEEVLVTVMRDHQNYFAVESSITGSDFLLSSRSEAEGSAFRSNDDALAPHFLAVLNTVANAEGEAVIRHGNARVLRARFNDARFFWEFDQRIPLADRVALLENVTFQKELGSYAAKSKRIADLSAKLGALVRGRYLVLDLEALAVAATICKTDLTTELVKEFTELQGEIGGLYARHQGLGDAVADAIYDLYRPLSTDSRIPRTPEGQLLALADKTDSIAGMFSLGLEPTGSRDPFALRRAANGIIKILAESNLPLILREVIEATGAEREVLVKMHSFFAERAEFYLREVREQAYDVVKAVLAAGAEDIRDAAARAEAVTAVRDSEDFAAVSAAFKRMKNILAQATEKGIAHSPAVDESLLTDPSEQHLNHAAARLAKRVTGLRAAKEYIGALEAIATLRPQVDAFFDAVMVMDPNEAIRANRLALLSRVLTDFSGIADFSEIVTAG